MNLISNVIKEFKKIYIYSPSLHQDLYQKLIKSFNNYIPIRKIPNILNEQDIVLLIDEIFKNVELEKSDTGIEINESIEYLKYPQEFENGGIFILDDSNGKKRVIHGCKQGLRGQDTIIYLLLQYLKITTDYQKEPSELMETYTISSNQIISKIFKLSIKMERLWIW